MPTTSSWQIQGNVILACNCDFGCPCNFNGLPTPGFCEGNWNWKIVDGHFGDVALDGITFSLAVKWPGAIHEGGGEGLLVIDEKADDQQRDAIMTLVSGQAGGPWQIIGTTIAKLHPPVFARYDVNVDGFTSSVKAGEYITLQLEPVRNKKTGAEVHPRAILPEGFVFKEADLASSSVFHIDGPVQFDHTGRYAAAAPFQYQSA